ncbi:MAG: hypothetical protein FWC13_08925 [Oscillospiraceae bacterium]|nr:hypothetical protein [Oscillospiraceae bacterium]
MIKKLSKREKILLFSAILLLVSYVTIQFVIFPMFERYTQAQVTLQLLSDERAIAEAEITNLPIYRSENAFALERLDEITSAFPVLVPNEDIDMLMTSLVLRHNHSPTLLNITRQQPPQGAEEGEPHLFTFVTVNMNLIGSLDSLYSLVHEVEGLNFMRITNLSHSAMAGAPQYSTNSITFELKYIIA